MWQKITTNATETHEEFYRNVLTQMVQIATSKHISSVDNIDTGGTGYNVGDILTYTHASALLDASFEVTAESGNVITALRIIDGGAFGRRVATVTRNAGGTGYAVGDIVEIDEGHVATTDFRQRAKARVTAETAGVVDAGGAALIEGGGNYDGGTDPTATASTTTKIGPVAGSGSGLTLDTTMQAITSNLNLVLTGGGGGTVQIDVTLTNTGWVTLRDDHDYSFNSLTDEKQVVLQGTVAGGDEPLLGWISWSDTDGPNNFFGLLSTVMDSYNDGFTLDNQVGVNVASDIPSATSGTYIPSFDEAEDVWFTMDGRRIAGAARTIGTTVTAYHQFYAGLMDPFGTAVESPYPMFQGASVSGTRIWREASTDSIDVTGLTECFRHTSRTGPMFYRRVTDGSYQQVINGQGTGFPLAPQILRNMFPIGEPTLASAGDADSIVEDGEDPWHSGVCNNNGSSATIVLFPTPNSGSDLHLILPVVLTVQLSGIPGSENGVQGRLANTFWISATTAASGSVAAEDTFTDPASGKVYRIFPCGVRSEIYSFMCFEEA